MAREVQVTFDCGDPGKVATFWAEVLGYVLQPPPAPFGSWDEALDAWGVPGEHRNDRSAIVDPDHAGSRFFFQKVPEAKTVKNRLHLDVRVGTGLEGEERMTALEAECERLLPLGATRLRRFEPGQEMSGGHIVMADPEGDEFCLD